MSNYYACAVNLLLCTQSSFFITFTEARNVIIQSALKFVGVSSIASRVWRLPSEHKSAAFSVGAMHPRT